MQGVLIYVIIAYRLLWEEMPYERSVPLLLRSLL